MKILYISIAYSTENNGLYQNLVDSLLEHNHQIVIVRSEYKVSRTNYKNYKRGLDILTVKTGNPFSKNLILKGLNQIFLALYFKLAIKKYLFNKEFDLILYATPPITLASVIAYCKKIYDAKTFLMLKDIFPQNAVDLNIMKKSSLVYKYFREQEKKYYQYSDYIGCMSQGNKDYILAHNPEIKKKNIEIFPNSIKVEKVEGITFSAEKTVFIFGGNIGKPQNVSFLLKIIKKLEDYPKAKFIIIGDGAEKEKILTFIKENKCLNFIYRNQVSQLEYEELLKSVDVGLISLDPRFTIPNIPSKFQNYLKLNKPVLAITDVHSDIKEMILENKCGWWCDASNENEVIATIKEICENKEEQIKKGICGFEYLKKEFDVNLNREKIEKFIEKHKNI